ncbi:hypothetical protein CGRA01v4_12278 [Colletotrichum graminicola]|nr:hypothetical protein CGRA01v4_12278 [Colletotrichum graminicola]
MDTPAFLFSLFGDRLGYIFAHLFPPNTNPRCHPPKGPADLDYECSMRPNTLGVPLTNLAIRFCGVLHRLSTLAPR